MFLRCAYWGQRAGMFIYLTLYGSEVRWYSRRSFNGLLTQGYLMIGSKTLKMGQYWPYFLLMLWDEGTKHLSHLSSNGGSRHTKRCWSEASSRLSTSWFQNHPTGLLLLLFTFQSPQSHCAETESYTWLETIRLLIHSLWKSGKNLVNGQGSIRVAQLFLTWRLLQCRPGHG